MSRDTWITGKFNLGIANEAGQRQTEFCQENTLVIENTRDDSTYVHHLDDQYQNQIDYIICSQRWRSSIQSVKTRPGTARGSDYEPLIVEFRLKLKRGVKITRPVRHDLNQITYYCTVEVTNRFKELDMVDMVPEGVWTEVCNILQEAVTKTIPMKKKCNPNIVK